MVGNRRLQEYETVGYTVSPVGYTVSPVGYTVSPVGALNPQLVILYPQLVTPYPQLGNRRRMPMLPLVFFSFYTV